MSKIYETLINEMDPNTIVIIADAEGAKIVAKLRGIGGMEAGQLFGAALASMDKQIKTTREYIAEKSSFDALAFDEGVMLGRMRTAYDDNMMVHERNPKGE